MNILVVTQYYYPETFRINDVCEELVRRGHSVTVLTGLPNYPSGEIFKGYEDSFRKVQIHNSVRIIRFKIRPRHKGKINLLLNYLSFVINGKKAIKRLENNFDVVFACQLSPILSVIPAIKFKKKHGIPLYLYVYDLWPESIRDRGIKKPISDKNILFLIAKIISKKIYQKADMIGTKCEEFSTYLINTCGVEKKKCRVNHEHAENNYLNVLEKPIDNGIIDFMYLGNIGSSSNCELLIEAAKLIADEHFYIHFVGDGSRLTAIKKMVISYNLETKVFFHERCSQENVISFYNYADVCVLMLPNSSAIGLTPPGKLYSYMASCRPIIASADGASRTIIEESNCGLTCQPNNPIELAKLMKECIHNYKSICHLGKNGRSYFINHFTLDAHINNLIDNLKELLYHD